MKQLSFLQSTESNNATINKVSNLEMFIDGASRSNPGPAGAGIFMQKGSSKKRYAFFLGSKTNNQAEYLALILGLMHLKTNIVTIISDSELLVKQIKGEYKVRNDGLKYLYNFAIKLLHNFDYKIMHVLREKNKEADKLANLAIDKKVELPDEIKKQLLEENIKI